MKRTPPFSALGLGALLWLSACGAPHAASLSGAEIYPEDGQAYDAALKAYSAKEKIYRDYETRLTLKGTLLSPSFQQSHGEEIARRQILSTSERDALLAQKAAEAADGVWLIFTVSAPNQDALNLHREGSDWRVRLRDSDGHGASPLQLEKLHFENDLEPSQYFPYITRWDEAYKVQFPAGAPEGTGPFLSQSGQLTLQVAGPVAAGELHFPAGP